MNQFQLLVKRRFGPFFCTQALGAFNDNAFRNALVMLVAFHLGLGDHTVALYTNLAPALFILPFFLFSATAGQLAEKYEKSRIIRYVKLFEIGAMALALFGFYTHNVGLLLTVLFFMGVHSATFGPSSTRFCLRRCGARNCLAATRWSKPVRNWPCCWASLWAAR